jgi:hypothetical protein
MKKFKYIYCDENGAILSEKQHVWLSKSWGGNWYGDAYYSWGSLTDYIKEEERPEWIHEGEEWVKVTFLYKLLNKGRYKKFRGKFWMLSKKVELQTGNVVIFV